MVTHNEHLKNILEQLLYSYKTLNEIKDKPGDIDVIKKELLKINGFIKVIVNKIEPDTIPLSDFKTVKSKLWHYLDNYYFEKEIETMSTLYSDDIGRVKNMRLKILEALNDKKMINNVRELTEKL